MGKTAQRFVQILFGRPAQEVIWDLYYVQELSMVKIAKRVKVSTRTIGTWMQDWGYGRREYGKDLQVPPRPEVKANG